MHRDTYIFLLKHRVQTGWICKYYRKRPPTLHALLTFPFFISSLRQNQTSKQTWNWILSFFPAQMWQSPLTLSGTTSRKRPWFLWMLCMKFLAGWWKEFWAYSVPSPPGSLNRLVWEGILFLVGLFHLAINLWVVPGCETHRDPQLLHKAGPYLGVKLCAPVTSGIQK